MKVAQHEVLGKDVKGSVRPAGDDRNVWLLVSYTTTQGVDRSSLRDGLAKKRQPSTEVLGCFHLSLWDDFFP
ncbi:MAG TPA: hypothetical protein VFO40_24855 [Chthoniobacterales bacterium]|nr:hypothetical protein [Chthoniobacterales bacterium]